MPTEMKLYAAAYTQKFSASSRRETSSRRTLCGCRLYMTRELVHELFNGTADTVPTAAADVWSLGIILRRLVFKELPWLDWLNLLAQVKSLDLAPNRAKADGNEAVRSRVYANVCSVFAEGDEFEKAVVRPLQGMLTNNPGERVPFKKLRETPESTRDTFSPDWTSYDFIQHELAQVVALRPWIRRGARTDTGAAHVGKSSGVVVLSV